MSRLLSILVKIISTLLVFATAFAILLLYAIRQIAKPPVNNPKKFLEHDGRRNLESDQRLVVCLGASIVHGRVCVNFVDLAASRLTSHTFRFVNAGVNGDTSYHVLQRLDQIIACQPDYVIILVGTNDVLCTLIPDQWRRYFGNKRLPSQPTLESYRANLREIVQRLQRETPAKVAICSLPLLGEDLTAAGDQLVTKFNAAIKQICEEEQITYLPVHEQEATYLTDYQQRHQVQGKPFRSQQKEITRFTFAGAIRHYLLGQSWDDISRSRGMGLKTDLIHGNSVEAGIIADNIVTFLR